MADNVLFFTELLGLKVYDLKGRRLGTIKDAALVPLVDAIRVDRYLLGGGWAWLTVRYDQIRSISLDGIQLQDEKLVPYHRDDYMLRLGRDLLDQQIIDVHGRKVVRVTDITFETVQVNGRDELRMLEVDVGLRSIFRRIVQGVVPPRWSRRAMVHIPPNSIRWEFCNIVEADPQRRLRLNITHSMLEKMHPADLADIVEELSPEDREAIFETLDCEVAAEALSEVSPGIQASIIESLETEKAAEIIEEMSPGEAADVLSELEQETSDEILEEMHSHDKEEVRELLEHEDDTAGGMMSTEYLALSPQATVADAVFAMRENEEITESLHTILLVDSEERLVGAVPVARLFTASTEALLETMKVERLIKVDISEHQDKVTETFDKYNLLALPVVDRFGKLAGVITADDIITVLRNA